MEPSLVSRLECIANKMESILSKHENSVSNKVPSNSMTASPKKCAKPELIDLLDNSIKEKLEKFHSLSAKMGGDMVFIEQLSKSVFDAHSIFLWDACGRKQPSKSEFEQLVSCFSKKICSISELKEKQRGSQFYDHICALEAAVFGLGWVALPKAPAPFIKDALDTSLFYINRIFMAHKGKNDDHFEWAKLLKDILSEIHVYVLKYHTTGLVWNSEPGTKPFSAIQTSANCNAGAPPPPPPPPDFLSSATAPKSSNVTALLDSLNTGLAAASRLRKVTPEMQTHKNPSLRCESVVKKEKQEQKLVLDSEASKKHEPRILWDGKNWKVDFQVGNKEAVVTVNEKKESVYIYKCVDSVIQVKGKANAITLDGCKRTSVVFDGLVAQCEIINSQSIQVQTLGELPTVSIQKTDGCHIFLSRDALTAQIIASKSSEMNLSAQLTEDNDEYSEMALPEQFVTRIEGKKLVTVASEIV